MRLTLLNLFLVSSAAFASPVFIGTDAKAIYLADFDAKTGKLSEPVAVGDYKGPGFLAFHPTKPILYAVGKPNTAFPDKTGAVAAFSIAGDNKLTFLGEASSGGMDACHVAVDDTGKTLAIANYSDGKVSTIQLDENGLPGKIVTLISPTGAGPTARQKGPHAHGVYFDKSNKFLFEPDLGLDKVFVFKFDASKSTLTASGSLPASPGAGPRHLAFSPDQKNVYVINELNHTIQVADYDGNGNFKEVQTVKTLPAEGFSGGENKTSEIAVSADGKFVYGSNRGHDSIVVYARGAKTGELTLVQHAPAGGKAPRHFTIDPSGKWMLIGHQDSNGISIAAIDPKTGKLGEPSAPIACPSPICLLFAK